MDHSQLIRTTLASWFGGGSHLAITDSCVLHAFDRTVEVDSDRYHSIIEGFRTGFPDVQWSIRHVLTDKAWGAAHVDIVGTHLGSWQGLEPTGRRIKWEHMLLFRFEGDLIAEIWEVFDPAQIMTQLTGTR